MDLLYILIIFIVLFIVVIFVVILVDKLFGGGGECKIIVNKDNVIIIFGREIVLNVLINNKIFLFFFCGGKVICGICKFRLVDWYEVLKFIEILFLLKDEISEGVCLLC